MGLVSGRLRPSFFLPLSAVVVVVAVWSPFLAPGLRVEDFPGHVALIGVLSEILAADPTLPLWNGREYAGTSLVIAYLHPIGSLALLSPFTWIFGAETGVKVGGVVYLALAAATMYAWLLDWGRSQLGAALGSVIYVLHPGVFGFVGGAGQMHQPVTLALIPLVFLAWTRLGRELSVSRVLIAAVASALLLLDMQRFFIVMPFAIGALFATSGSRRLGMAASSALAVAVAVALLMCFPVLPILEERPLLQWHAPHAIEAWRQNFSFTHLLQLMDRAGAFGPILSGLPAAHTAAAGGAWYQGAVVLAFVGLGSVFAARSPGDATQRLRLAVTLGATTLVVALAFGPHALFARNLELSRDLVGAGPAGFGALAVLLLVAVLWLAAFYWLRAALLARWPGRRWLVDLGVIGAVLLLGFGTPFSLLSRMVVVYEHIRGPAHFAFPLLGFLLASAVCLVAPAWERVLGTRARMAVLAAGFLLLHGVDILPYVEKVPPAHPVSAATGLRDAYRSIATGPEGRMYDLSGYSPLADMLGARDAGRPSAWGWLGWSSTRHTSELLGEVGVQAVRGDFEQAAQIAGLANVRFFSRLAFTGGQLEGSPALEVVVSDSQLVLAVNRRVLPYAQYYPKLAWVSGPNPVRIPIIARLAQAGVASYTLDPTSDDPAPDRRPDYVWGVDAARLRPGVGRTPESLPRVPSEVAAPCEVERPRDVAVDLQCRFDAPGVLVIAESWSPRWSVAVDGEERPLLRVNHAFQGVEVDAGDREVHFIYTAPTSIRVSLAVSAASWLAVIVYGGVACVRRKPKTTKR